MHLSKVLPEAGRHTHTPHTKHTTPHRDVQLKAGKTQLDGWKRHIQPTRRQAEQGSGPLSRERAEGKEAPDGAAFCSFSSVRTGGVPCGWLTDQLHPCAR